MQPALDGARRGLGGGGQIFDRAAFEVMADHQGARRRIEPIECREHQAVQLLFQRCAVGRRLFTGEIVGEGAMAARGGTAQVDRVVARAGMQPGR